MATPPGRQSPAGLGGGLNLNRFVRPPLQEDIPYSVGAGPADVEGNSHLADIAQALAAQNKAQRDRLKNVKAATDNDITDDVGADGTVGAGRAEAARYVYACQ